MERFIPLAYGAIALGLVILLLPTVLRPPRAQSPQTAELSPDAPPTQQQDSIIANFNRGVSGTAGVEQGALGAGPDAANVPGGGPSLGAPTASAAARACPHGVGNPPRQTFSIYSAPCAPAWSGDNGGATWRGVTSTEIRVAIGSSFGDIGTNGPVASNFSDSQSQKDRTLTAIQMWLNANYQFYGRHIQLYVTNINSENPNNQKAATTQADEAYHVFGAVMGRESGMLDLTRRGIVTFPDLVMQMRDPFIEGQRPYGWEWWASTTQMAKLTAEYLCKKLMNKRAEWAGDPLLQNQNRVFGLAFEDDEGHGHFDRDVIPEFQRQCGGKFAATVGVINNGDDDGSQIGQFTATAAVKLKQAGVTTVVTALDLARNAAFSDAAQSQDFFPEWFVAGQSFLDQNFAGSLQNAQEWAHAFGLASREIDTSLPYQDGYRAYKEMDPDGTPDNGFLSAVVTYSFPQLEQLANGIQLAGPHLTPETLEQGLFKMGYRAPSPVWSLGGGWGPGHHHFADYVGEVWWDPTAHPDDNDAGTGAYRWTHNGRRYGIGQFDSDTSQLFRDGIIDRRQLG